MSTIRVSQQMTEAVPAPAQVYDERKYEFDIFTVLIMLSLCATALRRLLVLRSPAVECRATWNSECVMHIFSLASDYK